MATYDQKQYKSPTVEHESRLKSWLWTFCKYTTLFLIIYFVVNWWRQPVMPSNPNLVLTDHRGQIVDLNDLSAHSPVLVYFWGTWCPICQVSSPKINSIAETSNYPVVTIAVQSGNNKQLQTYLSEHNYRFTTINDESGLIFNQWQGQVTPSYVILKNGELTQSLTGIQPEWSLKLRLWLSSLSFPHDSDIKANSSTSY